MADWTESRLFSAALDLGAERVAGWSPEEGALARHRERLPIEALSKLRDEIRAGGDPLGNVFNELRSPARRRDRGATYTPAPIVEAMVDWAAEQAPPECVVDPGTGSGRFLLCAGRRFPGARLLGVEVDPLAATIARANLAVAGLETRTRIVLGDYREASLVDRGRTLFVGNPPYVRHHRIEARWKGWLASRARELGLPASGLAGLHAHFYLATALHARPGDFGVLITAAEWLDVNYGALVRALFLEALGGESLTLVEPRAETFPDAAATAVVATFRVGARPSSIRLRRVERPRDLTAIGGGRRVGRERLARAQRWSRVLHGSRSRPAGFVELGELCRVHRGQVTGANKVWIAGPDARELPASVLFPAVTKARDLFSAGAVLEDASKLRCVVDLPEDLDRLGRAERSAVERFLRAARRQGADRTYVARHRRAWWSVGLREPAPILATYMARRSPAFVRNVAAVRHINIAHGLYPRDAMLDHALRTLADHLSGATQVIDGRTYAGGLTKFEPGEMERLLVPGPELLARSG